MSTQAAEVLIDAEEATPEDTLLDDATADVATAATGDEPTPARAEPEDGATTADADVDEAARLVPLLEGLLFAAGAPVPVARLVEALDGPDRRQVLRGLDVLAERLEEEGRGLRVVRVAGGYQLRTLAEHGPWVRRLLGGKPPRLSRAMLETLAIVAYRQPCTKPEIEAIRGVDVDAVLSTLLERRMVRIVGRKEAPGRPILYGTTKEFLEVFSLPDLDALPPLKDLGDLAQALERADDGEPVEAAAEDAPEGAPAAPQEVDVATHLATAAD
jgi:segregation and condensation protein B